MSTRQARAMASASVAASAAPYSSVRLRDRIASTSAAGRMAFLLRWVARGGWWLGTPARLAAVGLLRLYRVTLSAAFGARCRFYPSCSAYAEQAIRELGLVRGSVLAGWRVLRCSPLSAGGVEYPPTKLRRLSDAVIHEGEAA